MNEDPFKQKNMPGFVSGNQEKNIKTRIATPEDWQVLKNIRLLALDSDDAEMFGPKITAIDKARSDEDWKAELNPDKKDQFYLLSFSGQDAIGMLKVSYYREADDWYISSAYTKEDSRGKVFPRAVIALIIEEVKKRGGSKLGIGVRKINVRSMRLYELLGFKKVYQPILERIRRPITWMKWQEMEMDIPKDPEN